MNKKLIKRGGIIVGLLFLTAVGIGLYMYNKPHRNISTLNADYVLTASELYNDFSTDEAAANQKYLSENQGKVIEVSGIVKEINRDQQGGFSFVLNEPSMATGGVSCSISQNETEKAIAVKKGDKITLKGECAGYLDLTEEVTLVNCVIM